VQSEAVNALVGRAEILAFSFVVLSFLLFARKANPILVGASFLLALLSKESALFAFPLFGIYRRDWARLSALGGAVVAAAAIRVAVLGGLGISGREIGFLDNPLADAGLGTRALAAPVLLYDYVRLALWPWPLSADYSFNQIPLPEGVADFRVLVGALALSLLVYAIVRGGPFRIAALVFVVPLAGTLHLLFPLGTIFAERLLYLPMLGAALAFGLVIDALAARRAWVSAAIAAVVLGASAMVVLKRSSDWRDNESLFRRTVATAPASARSHFLLGAELLEQKRFAESAERFARGLEIYPAHFGARMSLGEALLEAGDAARAEREFRRALETEPASADARKAAIEAALSHGRERARASDFAAAKESFERAIALDENRAPAWNYLGLVAEREGRVEDARRHYERALGIDATSVEALLNLASLELNAGELSSAEEIYRRAIGLAPGSYEAYNGLGIALARQGRTLDAAEAFEKAIAIDPTLETARENLRALSPR
jgi:tetratricopeptide (TPR) repeat protein